MFTKEEMNEGCIHVELRHGCHYCYEAKGLICYVYGDRTAARCCAIMLLGIEKCHEHSLDVLQAIVYPRGMDGNGDVQPRHSCPFGHKVDVEEVT